ncbi:MAG TPA: LytTR family DNA-binding domain-containing protein, partial [Flavobacterium sp.]|uniref:LytR/AlgR family response regulator transcription factor n=1 Tax=Flavobacterium sp. TaxID=239 RepID=UPI002D0EA7A8
NIIYAESQKNYLLIITPENEYRYRSTITEFMDKLSANFVKTHKGFIVNKTKIDGYNSGFITIGSKKIPISKTYKDQVINELNNSPS